MRMGSLERGTEEKRGRMRAGCGKMSQLLEGTMLTVDETS